MKDCTDCCNYAGDDDVPENYPTGVLMLLVGVMLVVVWACVVWAAHLRIEQ